jgi:hypothetical protein
MDPCANFAVKLSQIGFIYIVIIIFHVKNLDINTLFIIGSRVSVIQILFII